MFDFIQFWIIYAFMGWIVETIYVSWPQRKFVERGFLHGPLIPIYGFGALIILYVLNPHSSDPLFIFSFGFLLTSLLEYITSYLMEKIFDMRWWDYSQRPFNINGRVCLRNSLLFALLSLVLVEVIHPLVQDFLNIFHPSFLKIVSLGLLCLIFIDFLLSVLALIDFKNHLETIHKLRLQVYERSKGESYQKDLDEFFQSWEDGILKTDAKLEAYLTSFEQEKQEILAKISQHQRRLIDRFPNIRSDKFNSLIKKIRDK